MELVAPPAVIVPSQEKKEARSSSSVERPRSRAQLSALTGKNDQPRQCEGWERWRMITSDAPGSGGSRQALELLRLP